MMTNGLQEVYHLIFPLRPDTFSCQENFLL